MTEHPDYTLPRLNDRQGDLGKEWFVSWTERQPSGRMKRFKTYKGLTGSEAQRRAAAKQIIRERSRYLRNRHAAVEKAAMPELVNAAARDIIEEVRAGTAKMYWPALRTFLEWCTATNRKNLMPDALTSGECDDFRRWVREQGELKPKTRNGYIIFMARVWRRMIVQGHCTVNPWLAVERERHRTARRRIYEPDLRERVIAHLREHYPFLLRFIQLEYYCALRPGEIRKLLIGDISLDSGLVLVRAEVSKNGLAEMVTIPNALRQEMVAWEIASVPASSFLFGIREHGAMRPVGENYFGNQWRSARAELGLGKEYTMYAWKHTGGVALARKGVSTKTIQLHFRHSDLNTLDRYLREMGGHSSRDIREDFPDM